MNDDLLQEISTDQLIAELERRGTHIAIWKTEFMPDISKCPKCNGPADNGHDRCVPPNPYFCTKCSLFMYNIGE